LHNKNEETFQRDQKDIDGKQVQPWTHLGRTSLRACGNSSSDSLSCEYSPFANIYYDLAIVTRKQHSVVLVGLTMGSSKERGSMTRVPSFNTQLIEMVVAYYLSKK